MLHLIKQKALEAGFIVSRMQVDRSLRLNSMEQFYYHIMHNLSVPGIDNEITSFEDIFDTWLDGLRKKDKATAAREIQEIISILGKYNSSFARAFLFYIRARIDNNGELARGIMSWITGEKNIPTSLKAQFQIIGNVDMDNSMDFLKAFIKLITLIGYKGIVILVDELELIMNERSDIRRISFENLRSLIDLCGSGELHNCMFIFAGTDELFSNEERGIKTYSALSQRLGDALNKQVNSLYDIRQPILRLQRLSLEDYYELTEKIVKYYSESYDFEAKISVESIRNWTFLSFKQAGRPLESITIREFIIKLIEILDIMEQNPENKIFASELKMLEREGKQVFINARQG